MRSRNSTSNTNDNTLSVIDTATASVITTLPVGSGRSRKIRGDGLIDKLEEAGTKIDAGQTSAACNQLSAFINQVNGLINNGSLSSAHGQALINAANAVKTNLGC